MSKNEEQFYGMFRDAFEGYSPEVPAHIYDNVRAGMVRTGVAWKKWSAIALLLIGTGALTIAFWPQDAVVGQTLNDDAKQMNVSKVSTQNVGISESVQQVSVQATNKESRSQQNTNSIANNSTQVINAHTADQSMNHLPEENNTAVEHNILTDVLLRPQGIAEPVYKVDSPDISPEQQSDVQTIEKKVWPIKVKKTVKIEE